MTDEQRIVTDEEAELYRLTNLDLEIQAEDIGPPEEYEDAMAAIEVMARLLDTRAALLEALEEMMVPVRPIRVGGRFNNPTYGERYERIEALIAQTRGTA